MSARLLTTGQPRRWRRFWRALRAVWRDTSALAREFRRPILLFLVIILGGGLFYRELLAGAGYGYPPLVDMPYIMLRLMVFEPHLETAPPEIQIIAFWYLMPLLAIYILGRGASDFVRLFFNRDERRDAWREAVASTYRDHIIIVGVGHVGLRVLRTLAQMGFGVVGIDEKAKPELNEEMNAIDVTLLTGDARDRAVLSSAGLRYAQALIVCTASDNVNVEIIMRARDMNPDIRIVARMWDDQFTNQISRFMNVQAVLSASDLAAPAFAGAAVGIEITQTLRIQGVEYSMIRLQVAPGSFLDGQTVGKLQDEHNMDIVLHGRGDDIAVQPDSKMLVRDGDMLVIFARHDRIINLVERNRRNNKGK
ncbi:MAG: TrkA family potassium uptake protein [Chloroflexi bacterium]|nr:TrkA family potassium uptake protein [Chloroflexota bacterium]